MKMNKIKNLIEKELHAVAGKRCIASWCGGGKGFRPVW